MQFLSLEKFAEHNGLTIAFWQNIDPQWSMSISIAVDSLDIFNDWQKVYLLNKTEETCANHMHDQHKAFADLSTATKRDLNYSTKDTCIKACLVVAEFHLEYTIG